MSAELVTLVSLSVTPRLGETKVSNFGARVSALMMAAGLSNPAVAKKLGVTQQVVRRWRKDKEAHISGVHLVTLSRLLNVRCDWLATGEGPPSRFNAMEYTQSEMLQAFQALSALDRKLMRDLMGVILKYRED